MQKKSLCLLFEFEFIELKNPDKKLSKVATKVVILLFANDHLISRSFMIDAKSLRRNCIRITTITITSSWLHLTETMAFVISSFETSYAKHSSFMCSALVTSVDYIVRHKKLVADRHGSFTLFKWQNIFQIHMLRFTFGKDCIKYVLQFGI